MSVWLLASIVLATGFVPCALACVRAGLLAGLPALNLAGIIAVLVLVTLTEAFKRQPFIDLAVVLAPTAFAGSMAFIRFVERER